MDDDSDTLLRRLLDVATEHRALCEEDVEGLREHLAARNALEARLREQADAAVERMSSALGSIAAVARVLDDAGRRRADARGVPLPLAERVAELVRELCMERANFSSLSLSVARQMRPQWLC